VFILTSDVLHRATTSVLYALAARHLSVFAVGPLSLTCQDTRWGYSGLSEDI
jgi:hypothetical protein